MKRDLLKRDIMINTKSDEEEDYEDITIEELLPVWRENGKYYGYPTCCIEDLCDRGFDKEPSPEQIKASSFSGFVPCVDCSKKVNEGLPLQSLITDRRCKTPFQ